jgi:hypothetical protein
MSPNLTLDQTVMTSPGTRRSFEFARDSFAFHNELVWAYHPDPVTGQMTFRERDPKPTYAHRCFALARVARQFFYHARFEPEQPVMSDAIYRERVRAILSRNPRIPCQPANQIIFPGFSGLREFSRVHEPLLKDLCGGAWRSYFLRSHWRMIFPISRSHQTRTARSLIATLGQNLLPIVHVVQFPSLTINHAIVLVGVTATARGWEFTSYDPNNSERLEQLPFDRASQSFVMPANSYWGGGSPDVIHISRSWFF